MMSDEEYQGLKDDIEANGQQEPIIIWQKRVIDGRNRLKACVELELKPVWIAIDDEADPVQYVLSHNLHRRHLTESQRAMVGARLRDIYDQQAAERRQSGLKKGTEIPVSDNCRQRENLGKSSEKAGKAVAVSGQSIDRATKVLKEGTPEQIAAVDHGKVSVSKAAKEVAAKTAPEPSRRERDLEAFRKAKSAAKQHNGAMVRFIDTMNELRTNPGLHRKALQHFEALDKIFGEWSE
jgi:ParB-like chromosome segregation protein Spo0J